jgi:hypothetical protein
MEHHRAGIYTIMQLAPAVGTLAFASGLAGWVLARHTHAPISAAAAVAAVAAASAGASTGDGSTQALGTSAAEHHGVLGGATVPERAPFRGELLASPLGGQQSSVLRLPPQLWHDATLLTPSPGAAQPLSCVGLPCFRETWLVLLALNVASLAVATWLLQATRPGYRSGRAPPPPSGGAARRAGLR